MEFRHTRSNKLKTQTSEENKVICKDGTTDVSNGENLPCEGHGGVKPQEGIDLVQGLSDTQKWLLLIGFTILGAIITIKFDKMK